MTYLLKGDISQEWKLDCLHIIRRVFFQSLAVVLEGIKIIDGWGWVRAGQVQFLVETKH